VAVCRLLSLNRHHSLLTPGAVLCSLQTSTHQGDAVTESVQLVDGYLYQLDARLARFSTSAELAGLPLPHAEERVRRILLDTAAASLKMNGAWRGWCCACDTRCVALRAAEMQRQHVAWCVERQLSAPESPCDNSPTPARPRDRPTNQTQHNARTGTLTLWLSRGRGGFGFNEAVGPNFYALLTTGAQRVWVRLRAGEELLDAQRMPACAHTHTHTPTNPSCTNPSTKPMHAKQTETAYAAVDRENGFKAYATPLPPRSPYFTTMRSVSQVESAVAHYEAVARGGDLVSVCERLRA
jgi:hypothetical protein